MGKDAHSLLAGEAIEFLCPFGPVHDPALHVPHKYLRRIHDLGLFLQRLLGPLALRDVTGNFRSTNNHAAAVSNRRNRRRNVDPRAILPHAHGFEMLHALAPSNARQNVGLLIHPIRREKHQHGFAHGFCCRVAKYFLGAAIPGVDRPVKILADNGVIRGFDNSGQTFAPFRSPLPLADFGFQRRRSLLHAPFQLRVQGAELRPGSRTDADLAVDGELGQHPQAHPEKGARDRDDPREPLPRVGACRALDKQPRFLGVHVASGCAHRIEESLPLQSISTARIGLRPLPLGNDACGEFERRVHLRSQRIQPPLLAQIVRRKMAQRVLVFGNAVSGFLIVREQRLLPAQGKCPRAGFRLDHMPGRALDRFHHFMRVRNPVIILLGVPGAPPGRTPNGDR